MNINTAILHLPLALLTGASFVTAGADQANYDESKVPEYSLPDPLITLNGDKVNGAAAWQNMRRPEILRLFEEHVYGRSPGAPEGMTFEVTSVDAAALGGKATRDRKSVV